MSEEKKKRDLTLEDLLSLKSEDLLDLQAMDLGDQGRIYLQELTGRELEEIRKTTRKQSKKGRTDEGDLAESARILYKSIVTRNRERMFETEDQCLNFILSLPGRLIIDLQEQASRLNSVTEEAQEEVKKN